MREVDEFSAIQIIKLHNVHACMQLNSNILYLPLLHIRAKKYIILLLYMDQTLVSTLDYIWLQKSSQQTPLALYYHQNYRLC